MDPYKVTYITINSDFDIKNKTNLYDDIVSYKTNSKLDLDLNNSKIELDKKYENLYKKCDGLNLNCYIFIGKITPEIIEILEKIEVSKNYLLNEDENRILENFFNYDYKKIWGDLNNYNKIKFIDSYIKHDDTINFIKTTICYKLNNFETAQNQLFMEQILLTCALDKNNYMKLDNSLTEIDIKPEDIIIQNIIKKLFKRRIKLNYENIKFELLSYGYTKSDLDEFFEKYLSDITNLKIDDIKTDNKLKLYINDYITNPILGHHYFTYNLTNIYINNYILNYLDPNYTGYDTNLNEIKHNLDESYNNKILNSIGNIKNNEIYIYNFKNIHQYILDKNIFDLEESLDSIKYFQGFISKYFPKINYENHIEFLNTKVTDTSYIKNSELYTKVIDAKTDIYSIIDDRLKYFTDIDVVIKNKKMIQLTIGYDLNLPIDIDIVSLFNDIRLSYDVPFVKLKDPNTKEIVYKIYKNITKFKNDKYIISKNQLINWINNNTYEFSNEIFSPIKGLPKSINYKLKLLDLIGTDENIGTIVKKNYFEDELISLELQSENLVTVNLEQIKVKKEDYEINDVIEFYNYETLYGDIEISKKGLLDLKINFANQNYIINNDITYKAIEKFNSFIDILKNIEYFKTYTNIILPIDKNVYKLNTNFYNSEITYNNLLLNIGINNSIVLEYDKIKDLVTTFFPYISFINELFYENQNIEYLSQGEDGNIWLEGTIKNVLENDRYDITLKDLKRGDKVLNNIDNKFIRVKGDLNYRKTINIVYKRISDFNDVPPLKQLIYKLRNLDKNVIFNRVIRQYDIPIEKAKSIIAEVLNISSITSVDTISKLSNKQFQIGINIKIHYLEPTNDKTNNYFKVYVDGFKSVKELDDIKAFLTIFFKTYLAIEDKESNRNFIDTYSDYINISDSEKINKKIIETSTKLDQDETVTLTSNYDDDLSNLLDDSDSSDDEDELDETPIFDSVKPVVEKIELEDTMGKISDFELIQSETKNPILKALYDNDNKLFDWISLNGKRYSKICQNGRYPIILNDEKKDYIDKHFPKSYYEFNSDIECSNETPKDKFNIKTKCSAIKWGSSHENQNWYICPKIWDLQDRISLNISDLKFKGLGYDLEPSEGKRLYGTNYLKTDFESSKIWRIDKTTGKDIIFFGPTYKGRGVVKNMKNVSSVASLLLEDSLNKKTRYSYPGFLKSNVHPDGLAVPCCFQGNSKNIASVFSNEYEDINELNDYIQGSDKSLEQNRLGLLPKQLSLYFNLNEEDYKTGALNLKSTYYLRLGIKQSHNSFFSLIASLKYDELFENADEEIINLMINNITEYEFKTLNLGNLEEKFIDDIETITPYQNYLEYILSDEKKNWIYFYDFLTRPQSWLFRNGLILVILEQKENNTYELQCPYFMNTDWYSNTSAISIVLKINDTFEPIFLYKKSNYPIKIFEKEQSNIEFFYDNIKQCIEQNNITQNLLLNVNSQNIKLSQSLSIKELLNKIKMLKQKLNADLQTADKKTQIEINKNLDDYKISRYILNIQNKIIGILTKNLTIIPCKPSALTRQPLEINKHYLYIHELKHLIYANHMTLNLTKLSELLEYNIKPIEKIINSDDKVVSLKLHTGHIIPTKQTEKTILDDIDYNNISNNDNLENIDKKISNYTKYSNIYFYKKKNNLYQVIEILNKIRILYSDPSKEINKFYMNNDYLKGIILKNGLLLTIESIKYDLIDREKTSQYLNIDLIEKTNNYKIIDYEHSIKNYFEIVKLSDNLLHNTPIRNLMNSNKHIIAVLLEDASVLDLHTAFKINTKKNGDYLIDSIIYNDIGNYIEEIKPKLYESDFIDDRIKYIKQINYKQNIYTKIKKTIASFLQLTENIGLKEYIKTQLNSKGKTITQKRITVYYLIEKLFSFIAKNIIITQEEFNKIITYNEIPEYNIINAEKCNNLTSEQDKELLIKETEVNLFNKMWLKYEPKYLNIIKDNIKLKEYLESVSITPEDNIKNIELFFDNLYTTINADSKTDIIIQEKLEQIQKTVVVVNNLIENIVKNKYFKCKYNIYTINSSKNNLFDIFFNNFLEDIVRNKFKRYQILENIKLVDEDIKYFSTKDEIIFYNIDMEAAQINELYITIKKKYYKNIQNIDEAQPIEIKYVLPEKSDFKYKDKYLINKHSKNLTYKINNLVDNFKLNNFKSKINHLEPLNEIDYKHISDYLDIINTNRSKKNFNKTQNYTYNLQPKKKNLLF
uniref:Uncharacterized protein n=1 Tax=viral metagenome TaxID=1070528 RepID=A0A6C0IVA4_9ZZZZ